MNAPRVALIDSGVGGLTLVQAIRQRFPLLSIAYANDNANFPYGPRPEEEVIQLVLKFVNQLQTHVAYDALIVGCNTASTVALPALRDILPIPVIGVVPAIKPAAMLTETGHIGLLATAGTVQRQYTRELISNFAANCQVHLVGSNELVLMAEQKLRGRPVDALKLREILAPLIANPIDVLVLGCTHFPLLRAELAKELGPECTLVDSGDAIALRTGQVLGLDAVSIAEGRGQLQAFFSEATPDVDSLRNYLAREGFDAVEVLPPFPT